MVGHIGGGRGTPLDCYIPLSPDLLYPQTGTATAAGVILSVPTPGYDCLSVQITGTFSGTVQFEGSNDNTNWVSVSALPVAGAAPITSTTAAGAWIVPARLAYLRVRCSAYSSGTITVTAFLRTWSDVPGTVSLAGTSTVAVSGAPSIIATATSTSNGLTTTKVIAAASTNATSIKTNAGRVYLIIASNTAASVRYLKIYNKASAPTVGTDVPVLTIALPAGSLQKIDLADIGMYFATGISLAMTTGYADADTGALTAGDVIANIMYI